MVKIKKFNRLVAFGCSNTYGQGLSDCPKGFGPSRSSWPFYLGKILNVENVVNLAVPGSSNKKIAKDIIEYSFTPQDLVVVGWSFIERSCIFLDVENNYLALGVNYKCKTNKIWQRSFFNDYDRVIETGLFSSLGAKHIKEHAGYYLGFFCSFSSHYFNFNIDSYEPIHNIEYEHILNTFGRAADEFHPSKYSHREIARRIKELLDV